MKGRPAPAPAAVPLLAEPIVLREFDGAPPIGEDGQPVAERVVYLMPYRTGRMRRDERNALLKLQNDEAVVRLGDVDAARAAAAIISWEGPGLDGVPITLASLDALPFDAFMERVYEEIDRRFNPNRPAGEEADHDPKALRSTSAPTAPSSGANVLRLPGRGSSDMSNVEPSWVGGQITWTA